MNELKIRTVTGIVLVSIITMMIIAGAWTFFLLVMLINWIGLNEFYRLNTVGHIRPFKTAGSLISLVFLSIVFLVAADHRMTRFLPAIIPIGFVLLLLSIYSKRIHPVLNLAVTLTGFLVVTLPLSFFCAIPFLYKDQTYHTALPMGYFLILWATDTGAFVIGKILGKHKLFERLSPGKTWEGAVGGACCALAAGLFNGHFLKLMPTMLWLLIAFVVTITGIYGDLFKSLLKREVHVKDAGNILPGYGGVLDRFDSLLGSAPFVFLILIFIYE